MPEFTADIAHRVDGCDHAHRCQCSAEPAFGFVIPSVARDLLLLGTGYCPLHFAGCGSASIKTNSVFTSPSGEIVCMAKPSLSPVGDQLVAGATCEVMSCAENTIPLCQWPTNMCFTPNRCSNSISRDRYGSWITQ